MKRLSFLFLSLVMVISLAACGGTASPSADPTAAPTTAPTAEPIAEPTPEPTDEPRDLPASDDTNAAYIEMIGYLSENATQAFVGETSADAGVIFIPVDTEGTALFAIANDDLESLIFFGDAVADAETSSVVITDEDMGATLTFIVTETQDDGSFTADLGDLGTMEMQSVAVDEALTAFVVIAGITEPVDASASGGTNAEYVELAGYLSENATVAFMGESEVGEGLVFIAADDIGTSLFAAANDDLQGLILYGESGATDDGTITIYDEDLDMTLIFRVTERLDDGGFIADAGENIGTFTMHPAEIDEAVMAFLLIAGITEPVL